MVSDGDDGEDVTEVKLHQSFRPFEVTEVEVLMQSVNVINIKTTL